MGLLPPKHFVKGEAAEWLEIKVWGWGCAAHPWAWWLPRSFHAVAAHCKPPVVFRYLLTWTKCWGNGMGQWLRAQRKVSVLQKGAACCRNAQQRVSVPLAIVGVSIRYSNSILAQREVLFIICNGLIAAPASSGTSMGSSLRAGSGSALRGEPGSDTAQGRAMSAVRAGTHWAPR